MWVLHDLVFRAGTPCAQALALDAAILSLSPVLADHCRMSNEVHYGHKNRKTKTNQKKDSLEPNDKIVIHNKKKKKEIFKNI